MAAQRSFSTAYPAISFVCADARFLPFKDNVFNCVFSYSVVQHFSEEDADVAIAEAARVLKRKGYAKIQLAHAGGLRSMYHRRRADYANAGVFRVRYWSLARMRDSFEKRIGPTKLTAEAFGGLGLLAEDWRFVSLKAKLVIACSTILKTMANWLSPLIRLADSVYVTSTKR